MHQYSLLDSALIYAVIMGLGLLLAFFFVDR